MTIPTLLKDRDWTAIDGQLCLVKQFVPLAKVENDKIKAIGVTTPLASVSLRTEQGLDVEGFIAHELDFKMLWAAFNERSEIKCARLDVRPNIGAGNLSIHGIGDDEEVWLMWTAKHYRSGAGVPKMFLPKLVVSVSRKGALELLCDDNLQPDLTGQARAMICTPLLTWTPEIMDL